MTSRQFHIERLEDLHGFFKAMFPRRASNFLRHKLGHAAASALWLQLPEEHEVRLSRGHGEA